MGKKLVVGSFVSLGLVILCFGAHLAGFQTDYWIVSSVNTGGTELTRNLGIWSMQVHMENGTIQYNSPMFGRVEHFIALGIAALNTVTCVFIAIKNLSMCVGITSFITSTLMIIVLKVPITEVKVPMKEHCTNRTCCIPGYIGLSMSVALLIVTAFRVLLLVTRPLNLAMQLVLVSIYTYDNVQSNMATLRIRYPESADHFTQSWSFYMVFVGIILNVVFTIAFMFALILNAEMKATKSDKGFGPKPESKRKYVYTIEHREENAYDNLVPELKEENAYYAVVTEVEQEHTLENITHL